MSEGDVNREGVAPPSEAVGRSRGRLRIGLALGPGHATAVELRGRRMGAVRSRPVGMPGGDGGWPSLADFLREVREAAGEPQAELALAVLRPHGGLKVLRLPPLRSGELARMVGMNAGRFFPVAEALLTGLVRVPAADVRGATTASVAAAPERVVEAVARAAGEAGCTLGHVTVGTAAALAGAAVHLPSLRRGRTALALFDGEGFELLCLDRGRPRVVRSLPASPLPGDPAERLQAVLAETEEHYGYRPDRVVVAGRGAPRVPDEAPGVEFGAAPQLAGLSLDVLAAQGAAFPSADTPLLLREARRLAVRGRQRRRTAVLCALSVALLAGAGATHLAQLRREVEEVRARRERIRPTVAEALRVRGEIQAVRARVDAFAALESARPRWVERIATLSATLPRDAHLASLAVSGEELRLDGQARSATALVPVFEAAPWVQSVRLGSPVRREQTPTGARERFSLTLGVGAGSLRGGSAGTGGGAR